MCDNKIEDALKWANKMLSKEGLVRQYENRILDLEERVYHLENMVEELKSQIRERAFDNEQW